MALIHDIQSELCGKEKDVGSALFNLKVLASKIEVNVLEDWVTHEIEGYPADVPVPDYRKTLVTYTGNFIGYNWQQTNFKIPFPIIAKYVGKEWLVHNIREDLSLIDWRVKCGCEQFEIAAARDLIIDLQGYGKIHQRMNLTAITGIIDPSAFIRIQQAVRAKVLDLTLKIEKEIPSVANINIGGKGVNVSASESEVGSNITQQVIHGNFTNITTTGDGNALQVGVGGSFVHALIKKGIDKKDAEELEKIAQKNPETPDKKSIANWVGEKLKQGAGWAQDMGKDVATETIAEVVKKFL